MTSWSTACPDWEKKLLAGESIVPVGALYPDEAEAALKVFRQFRVVDVAGAPTVGEIARPWIIDIATAFFGSYNPDTGQRHIQNYFLKVPKKNWKSGITAFLMGTLLIRNWRESGEFGIIAPTTEVANNAFGPLKHAIRKNEILSDLLHIQDHIRTITHRTTNATLSVVAAESDTVSGKKFAVTLIEELWQFGKRNNAEAMLMEATGGMASRDEGAVIYITTESDEPPAGVYAAKNLYARKVRDGEIVDPSFLPVLYEWPKEYIKNRACLDIDNAHIVNPNLGASVSEKWLRSKLEEAKAESAKAHQVFCAKHLNVEIGLALGSSRWAGAHFWEDQGTAGLSLEALLHRSEVCTIGIDGGGLDDMLGLAVLGREKVTGNWLAWTHAWLNPQALEQRKGEQQRYRDFEADGDLTICEVGEDIEQLATYVEQVDRSGLLDKIGVDQAGIGAIVDAIEEKKVERERILGIPQGWKLMGAIKTTERQLAAGALHHGGTRLMSWCVGNAKVEPRGNALMITKQTAGSAKIDPLMALFDAAALMAMNPQPRSKKYQMFIF